MSAFTASACSPSGKNGNAKVCPKRKMGRGQDQSFCKRHCGSHERDPTAGPRPHGAHKVFIHKVVRSTLRQSSDTVPLSLSPFSVTRMGWHRVRLTTALYHMWAGTGRVATSAPGC